MPENSLRKIKAAERARRYREKQPGYTPRYQSKTAVLRDLGVSPNTYKSWKRRERLAEARSASAQVHPVSYAPAEPTPPYSMPSPQQHAETMRTLIRHAPQALAEFNALDPVFGTRH